MAVSTEDRILMKVFWHEEEYGAKIDCRISQQVPDMLGLEERYVLTFAH